MKFLICVLVVCIGAGRGQKDPQPTAASVPLPNAKTTLNCTAQNTTQCCEPEASTCMLITCNGTIGCMEKSGNLSSCDPSDLCATNASTTVVPTTNTTQQVPSTPTNATAAPTPTPTTVTPTTEVKTPTTEGTPNTTLIVTTEPGPSPNVSTPMGSSTTEGAPVCSKAGFDKASFFGGIVLGAIVLIIPFVAFKYYRRKHTQETPYSQF